jgi:hypothetical protein
VEADQEVAEVVVAAVTVEVREVALGVDSEAVPAVVVSTNHKELSQ